MSNSTPLILLGSVLAGGVSAIGATVLLAPAPGPEAAQAASAGSEILAAIDDLGLSISSLSQRVEDLESTESLAPISGTGRMAASLDRSEIENVVNDILGSVEGAPASIASPSLESAVANVIEMREEREDQERQQRRADAEAKRMEDRLAKLQTDLGLDQTQVDSMRGIFQNQTVKVDEMRQSMREARDSGLDMGSMREMWTGLRDDTNTAVQGILSPSQYEQYEESNSNRGWGGRGGGDTGGGRGGRGGR
jgi:hypothetical protein